MWYVGAWLPLILMYWWVLLATTRGMWPVIALASAIATAALPMLAGIVVWQLSARIPSPETKPGTFAAIHLLLAFAFTIGWTGWQWLQMGLGRRHGAITTATARVALPWQAILGVVMYVLVAGIAYAVRQWLRARELALMAERADRLRAQAELASLRAHISPHFLFNTLHSVMALLRTDPALAEHALEHLSQLFRYVLKLDRCQVELVPLEEEWDFAASYLWLEQLRMGERLVVIADIDEESSQCAVPPFTLQPLVENAVRHGLAPKRGGGTVRVRAAERDGFVRLEVSDDGIGDSGRRQDNEEGLGVRAVRERLKAHFGDQATTTVDTAPDAGFRVRLAFPAEPVLSPASG
jgi:signal transduction histidine kinase